MMGFPKSYIGIGRINSVSVIITIGWHPSYRLKGIIFTAQFVHAAPLGITRRFDLIGANRGKSGAFNN